MEDKMASKGGGGRTPDSPGVVTITPLAPGAPQAVRKANEGRGDYTFPNMHECPGPERMASIDPGTRDQPAVPMRMAIPNSTAHPTALPTTRTYDATG